MELLRGHRNYKEVHPHRNGVQPNYISLCFIGLLTINQLGY